MEKCRAELFHPWIHKFGHEVIVHSVRYALHSHCTCIGNQLLFEVRFTPVTFCLAQSNFATAVTGLSRSDLKMRLTEMTVYARDYFMSVVVVMFV